MTTMRRIDARNARAPRVLANRRGLGRGSIGWILPVLLVIAWEAAARTGLISTGVLPAPSAVLAACWRLLRSGELVHNIGTSTLRALSRLRDRRRDRLRTRDRQRRLAHEPGRHRHDAADDPQRPAPGADPARHPLVRHRRGGQGVSGRARGVLPDLRQHASRHPERRSAAHRDGPHLRHAPLRAVPARDPARRAAGDLRRPALRPRHHVADADRGRNHRRLLRARLHGDAGARVHADRRRRAGDPDLRAARQARGQPRKALERHFLQWHPAFQTVNG